MKNSNKKGLSIVLAMGLVLVMSFMVLFILEYIIPFSRNVKGIENSTNSFYQAENGIEESLLFLKTRTNITAETGATIGTSVKYKFTTSSSGTTTPVPGEGNSGFDKNFDTVSQGNPIQLQVGYNKINLANTTFTFRIPDLNTSATEILSGATLASPNRLPIINWQLSSNNKTLNASGSYITASDINGVALNTTGLDIFNGSTNNGNGINYIIGRNLDDTTQNIGDFYTNNCTGTSSGCILKMSIINKLELNSNNTPIPYLEYKIVFSGQNALRFTTINSNGNSYSFSKNLKVRIPQQTTNEAFDFTVFQ